MVGSDNEDEIINNNKVFEWIIQNILFNYTIKVIHKIFMKKYMFVFKSYQ